MQMRVVDGPIMPRLILPNARPNTPLLRTLPLQPPAELNYRLYASVASVASVVVEQFGELWHNGQV